LAAIETSAAIGPQLELRACTTLDDFRQCVELQKMIWGYAEEDLLPVRLFVTGSKIGGQVFGAFDGSNRLVAFCLAVPGIRNGKSYLHSHILGVLPQYRDQHLGRRLKLMQREDALKRGITLIEWTFDPLELKNAFFNIERLGAIMRRYVPDQYGVSSSTLHAGLPTDRLVAEWWLGRERRPPSPASVVRLPVPTAIGEMKRNDREQALAIQTRLREQCLERFREGWIITGFDRGETESAYLLEKREGPTL
jgi:predicted GNAT superfamily acetyltransferase